MSTMKRSVLATLVLSLGVPLWASAQQPVYLDPSQAMDMRVDDLIQRLTPDIITKHHGAGD
jgi:hypothetical protein